MHDPFQESIPLCPCSLSFPPSEVQENVVTCNGIYNKKQMLCKLKKLRVSGADHLGHTSPGTETQEGPQTQGWDPMNQLAQPMALCSAHRELHTEHWLGSPTSTLDLPTGRVITPCG